MHSSAGEGRRGVGALLDYQHALHQANHDRYRGELSHRRVSPQPRIITAIYHHHPDLPSITSATHHNRHHHHRHPSPPSSITAATNHYGHTSPPITITTTITAILTYHQRLPSALSLDLSSSTLKRPSCVITQFCLTHFEGSRVWIVGLASCMMAKH